MIQIHKLKYQNAKKKQMKICNYVLTFKNFSTFCNLAENSLPFSLEN